MSWYVYMLRCNDDSLYTGYTNDIKRRECVHNEGKGAKYTRGRGPVEPVYLEYCEDKVAATKREAAIKKLPLKRKQLLLSSSSNRLGQLSDE